MNQGQTIPEYPYPNWKGRPTGDPADVIAALRQCRKAWASTCTMPSGIRLWAGHYHRLGEKEYRRLLGERLDVLYGSLPPVDRSSNARIGAGDAISLWRALIVESRIYGRPDFYGDPLVPSEPLLEPEERATPGGWLTKEELVAENKRLRWAHGVLENFLRAAGADAQEVLDATTIEEGDPTRRGNEIE